MFHSMDILVLSSVTGGKGGEGNRELRREKEEKRGEWVDKSERRGERRRREE